jgi:hypothetical protein
MNPGRAISLVLVLLFVLACGIAPQGAGLPQPPTAAAIATAAPATAAPPAATAPPVPTVIPPTATPETQQFFTEEFDKDLKYWPAFLIDGNNSVLQGSASVGSLLKAEAGALKFDLSQPYLWVYATYDPFDYKDVRVDARVENRGTNDNNISLICRYTKDHGWYEFNIANNGLYWIYNAIPKASGAVSYREVASGGSNMIKQGLEVNEYGIICNGNSLTLFINGKLTKEVKDAELSSGKVGLSVSSFNQSPVKVDFDWVKISQP